MQLTYRGIAYSPEPSTSETTESQHVGHFLGNRFNIRKFNTAHRCASAAQLKYRGVDYNA